MKQGDVWLVRLDPTVGHEQQGIRPVLIVSPEAFNQISRVPVVLPITTGGNFARRHGFPVSLDFAGTQTKGVIRCDQLRAVDLLAREARRLESVPEHIMDDVLARLATILDRSKSTSLFVMHRASEEILTLTAGAKFRWPPGLCFGSAGSTFVPELPG